MPKTREPLPWWPMFALPNVHTTFPIEVDGFGLVPADDFRIHAITRQQPRFGSFLKKFKTEFGDPIQPSTIIWRRDRPDTYRSISAVSGFRDLVSMSVIPLAWARSHQWSRPMGAMYSDAFAVYPWMVDNRGERLITRTPTMLGYHEVKRLRGQSTPALSPHTLNERDLDLPLMGALLKCWERCFATDTPRVEDERLFRSLNMAKAAAMLPAGADTKLYDTLRSVALWASAFEILRPAKNQAYRGVYADLAGLSWNLDACKEKKYEVFGEKPGTFHCLPVWLFGEIDRLRNDTLHGNPLPSGRLIVAPGKQAISMYAAPLYRMMLTAYLDLKLTPRKPTMGLKAYETYRQGMFESGQYQRDIESGLATIMFTGEEHRLNRQDRARNAMSLSQQVARAIAKLVLTKIVPGRASGGIEVNELFVVGLFQ